MEANLNGKMDSDSFWTSNEKSNLNRCLSLKLKPILRRFYILDILTIETLLKNLLIFNHFLE